MDGRPARPRRRSSNQDYRYRTPSHGREERRLRTPSRYRYHRARTSSHGREERRTPPCGREESRHGQGRRSPSHSSHSYRCPGTPRRRERSRSHDDEHRSMKRRRQPPYEWRYGENDERRSRNQLDGEPSKTRRKDQRRKYRRRRRRSPTSPSPRQESARLAGVVSEDDEGSVRPQDEKQQRAGSSSSHDDTKGHFRGGQGTEIAGRYRVIRDIGMGTFGRVVECLDLKRARRSTSRRGGENDGPRVAIKIVRDVKRYYDSALIEADIVEDVNRKGGRGTSLCAVMYDAFTWKSHYCLVFECLGPSLYDFLKRHDHQPFPMICVRDFAMQLLEALEFLHSFRLIHTDLKLENILLTNWQTLPYKYRGRTHEIPESTRIKLIDFGGATYDDEKKKSSIINTRQYRAPEVILELGWSLPSDLWSAGCILAELYKGELLFATHDNLEHLALMEKIIGPFPRRILKRAKHSQVASEAFDSNGRHRLDHVLPSESVSYVRKQVPLESIIREEDGRFLQLLRRILVIDPDERASAHECVRYRL